MYPKVSQMIWSKEKWIQNEALFVINVSDESQQNIIKKSDVAVLIGQIIDHLWKGSDFAGDILGHSMVTEKG